ncbi:hypothetical protein R3W88_007078 [Solanum pinnatisectum]|uniref:Uncharacterized protein n=1 Tax=Solanum pinnatisectum TaxID=50273 RepID=A0AAV9KJH0_9SOLN|nr:hypothetical protein R3W88_007078 [Solanum pinnatisectum]
MSRSEDNISGLTTIEDAVPLNQHSPGEGEDPDFDIPIWIHQNIIKFAKEFGVDIKWCKEEATSLFMKIDNMRQKNLNKEEKNRRITPTAKGAKELNSLECGSNFRSNGARSEEGGRGGGLQN